MSRRGQAWARQAAAARAAQSIPPPPLQIVGEPPEEPAPLSKPPEAADTLRLDQDTLPPARECPPEAQEGPQSDACGEEGRDCRRERGAAREATPATQGARPITYSRGTSKTDNHPQRRTAATFADFVAAIDADRSPKKGGAYIASAFNGDGRRCAKGALPRRWLPLDLDWVDPTAEPAVLEWVARFSACVWRTHSATDERPKLRVLIELDRDADDAECRHLGAVLTALLERQFPNQIISDPLVWPLHQPNYTPPVDVRVHEFKGAPLPADEYLRQPVLAVPTKKSDGKGAQTRQNGASSIINRTEPLPLLEGFEDAPADLLEALRYCDCDNRASWIAVLHALKAEQIDRERDEVEGGIPSTGVDMRELGRAWSELSPKFDADYFDRLWGSLNPTRTGIGAIFRATGRAEPRISDPVKAFKVEQDDTVPVNREPLPPLPDPPPGVVAEMVRWIIDNSYRQQPELALLGVLVAMSACCGGVYALPDGMRINLYGLGLVGTGLGKDIVLRSAIHVAHEAGAKCVGRPASGEGLQDEVIEAGDFGQLLLTIDEAGHYLGGDSAKVPAHIKSAAEVMLRLFSDSAGTHITRPKAGSQSKAIRHPGTALLGFSTPSVLGVNLTEESIGSGLLGRILLLRGREEAQPQTRISSCDFPRTVKEWANTVRAMSAFERDPDGIAITYETGVDDELASLTMRLYKAELEAKDERQRNVLRRSVEKVKRVAGVLAVAVDPAKPVMTIASVRWAEEFVIACNAHLLDFIGVDMVGTGTLADAARIRATVFKILEGKISAKTVTETELVRNGWAPRSLVLRHSKLAAEQFNKAIDHLVQADEAEVNVFKEMKSASGRAASGIRLRRAPAE